MDPDANLDEQIKLANRDDLTSEDAARLADLVLGLNRWLVNGGYLPKQWLRAIKGA